MQIDNIATFGRFYSFCERQIGVHH